MKTILYEAIDESNRFELSLIACVAEAGKVHTLFLSLLELHRCDAESIFKTVEAFLVRENLEITNVRFSGMDVCSTMVGIYYGQSSQYFRRSSKCIQIEIAETN